MNKELIIQYFDALAPRFEGEVATPDGVEERFFWVTLSGDDRRLIANMINDLHDGNSRSTVLADWLGF